MSVYTVNNQAELNAAILKLKGGDTLLLSSGSYSKLDLNGAAKAMKHLDFDAPVRIASADASRPATISELVVRDAKNVVLENLKFDYVGGKGESFSVTNSEKITIRGSTFDGHLDRSGHGMDQGLVVENSKDILVEDNKVLKFNVGINFSNVENLLVLDNDISAIRTDGARFAGVTDVRIEGNSFHDFKSPTSHKHKDSIQFWTPPDAQHSENVIIRDNTFSNKEGSHTIFVGTGMMGSAQAGYKNFLIEGNHLSTGHVHGIAVEHINGLVIRDNILERFPGLQDKQILTPIITVGLSSINVTISGNQAASVSDEAGPTWNVFGNDVTKPNSHHWTGRIEEQLLGEASDLYRAWVDQGRPDPDVVESGEMASPPSPQPQAPDDDDHFSFHAYKLSSAVSRTFDVDFEAGDTLAFRGFEASTFFGKAGGNAIGETNSGRMVHLDSVVDIAEIAARSQDVTATVRGDDLVVRIEQTRGTDTFVFAGLADDFRAANHPELF